MEIEVKNPPEQDLIKPKTTSNNIQHSAFSDLQIMWDISYVESCIHQASKRGYFFSLLYPCPISTNLACIDCEKVFDIKESGMECNCTQKIRLSSRKRKLIRNLIFFIHEIQLQKNGPIEGMPKNWPKIIVIDSKQEEKKNEKIEKVTKFRMSSKGAFSIYHKEASLNKLANKFEQIVYNLLLKS